MCHRLIEREGEIWGGEGGREGERESAHAQNRLARSAIENTGLQVFFSAFCFFVPRISFDACNFILN